MSSTLQYSPRTPLFHRRNFRRLFIAALVLFTFIIPAYIFRHEFVRYYHRAMLLHYQQQCLDYSPPPNTLIYSEDPADIARFAGSSDYSRFVDPWRPSFSYIARNMLPWNPFSMRLSVFTSSTLTGPGPSNSILMHALTSPTGQRRLVILDKNNYANPGDHVLSVTALFVPIQKFFSPENLPSRQFIDLPLSDLLPLSGHALRLYTPQFDHADPSRFTIPYEFMDLPGHIAGQFTTDAAGAPSIKLEITDGPLRPGSPSLHNLLFFPPQTY